MMSETYKQDTACEISHNTLKETDRSSSLVIWMHGGVLTQAALQLEPLYNSPFMHLSGIYSASAMQAILRSLRGKANLYSVRQNSYAPQLTN